MMELADEDLKTAIISTLKDVTENMNIMKREMENIVYTHVYGLALKGKSRAAFNLPYFILLRCGSSGTLPSGPSYMSSLHCGWWE